jgi:hypothetical protein
VAFRREGILAAAAHETNWQSVNKTKLKMRDLHDAMLASEETDPRPAPTLIAVRGSEPDIAGAP